MVKRNIKWLLVVLVLGLCPSILHAEDPYGEMKALADSAQKVLGQDRLPSINARWIKLARELNDTVQISDAHNNLISHYYQLGDIDHLKAAIYGLVPEIPTDTRPVYGVAAVHSAHDGERYAGGGDG
jgi:hypothetical protein